MDQIHPTTGRTNWSTPMKMVVGRSLRMPARMVPLVLGLGRGLGVRVVVVVCDKYKGPRVVLCLGVVIQIPKSPTDHNRPII